MRGLQVLLAQVQLPHSAAASMHEASGDNFDRADDRKAEKEGEGSDRGGEVELDLTWGEVLLLLVPAPDEDDECDRSIFRPTLSPSELSALRQAGLLGDFGWGPVPLDLTVLQAIAGDAVRKAGVRAGAEAGPGVSGFGSIRSTVAARTDLSAEVRRLSSERATLQRRLQATSRQLERRAEAVYAHFADLLRQGAQAESRISRQAAELAASLRAAERRTLEAEAAHAAQGERLRDRVAALEREADAFRTSLTARRADEEQRLELALSDERARSQRLETEGSLAQAQRQRQRRRQRP